MNRSAHAYTVLYFGLLGERRGMMKEQLASPAATPAELYEELSRQHGLGLAMNHLHAAVNDVLVRWDHPLAGGDTVAFLPPMSGG